MSCHSVLRMLSFCVAALAATTASANILFVGGPRVMPDPNTETFTWDHVADVAVDANGNRYIVGSRSTGSVGYAYLTKTTRAGGIVWHQLINLGTLTQAEGVSVDSSANVYVALSDDGNGVLQKYNTAGGFQWSHDYGFPGTMQTCDVDPSGNILTCGSFALGGGPGFGVARWLPDGTLDNYFYFSGDGTMNSMAFDPSGNVHAAGNSWGTTPTEGDGYYMWIRADWGTGTGYVYGSGEGTNDYFDHIVVEPSGMAVFAGIAVDRKTDAVQGFAGTADVNAGAGYYTILADIGGSTFTDLAVDSGGRMFLAGTSNLDGDSYGFIWAEDKDPADAWFVDVWDGLAQPVSAGNKVYAWDLAVLPDNSVVMAAADSTPVPVGGTSYRAWHLFHWLPDGTEYQRTVLGTKDFVSMLSSGSVFLPSYPIQLGDLLLFDHNYLTLVAVAPFESGGSVTGRWSGIYIPGPDDLYKTKEDTPLTVSRTKGVLRNDQNYFDLRPRTVKVKEGTVFGLSSLSLLPGGGFTAAPETNFNGDAGFQYDVYQGGSVVATYPVVIKVSPVNDAPIANNDEFVVPKNSIRFLLQVCANDVEPDGQAFWISGRVGPSHGTLYRSTDGKSFYYTPTTGYTGPDSFTYTVKDGFGLTSSATVSLTVQ